MGDLTDLQAADAVKVVGTTSTGVETNPLAVDSNGSAFAILRDVAGAFLDPRQIRALTAADIVTVHQGTSPWVVSGTFWQAIQPVSGTVAATQSGTWTTGRTWTLASGTDSVAAVQSGTWSMRLQDGAGNLITSQVNGAQRALDVGINVAGVQIDPRAIRALTAADIVTANQGTANSTANAWPTKLTDGTNTAKVTTALDLQTDDRINTTASDTVVALTTTPIEAKVGASALTERKYLILEGLSLNIKWGFSNTTQSFDLFKNQVLVIPVGPNVHVWMKTTTGTGSAGVGEGA